MIAEVVVCIWVCMYCMYSFKMLKSLWKGYVSTMLSVSDRRKIVSDNLLGCSESLLKGLEIQFSAVFIPGSNPSVECIKDFLSFRDADGLSWLWSQCWGTRRGPQPGEHHGIPCSWRSPNRCWLKSSLMVSTGGALSSHLFCSQSLCISPVSSCTSFLYTESSILLMRPSIFMSSTNLWWSWVSKVNSSGLNT